MASSIECGMEISSPVLSVTKMAIHTMYSHFGMVTCHYLETQNLNSQNPLTLTLTLTLTLMLNLTLTLPFLQNYPVHLSTSHYSCPDFDCPDFVRTPFGIHEHRPGPVLSITKMAIDRVYSLVIFKL